MIIKADDWFSNHKELPINQIICADYFDIIPLFPPDSFNLLFTDPPWNRKKNYGIYKDNLGPGEYKKFIREFIKTSSAICQNRFAIILGSRVLKDWWNMLPGSHPIIIKVGAITRPQNNGMSLQWKALLVNFETNQYCPDLWEGIRWPGEGYFYRDERFGHPAMTPHKLGTRVLKHFTREPDIILDPFMGVGSIPLACEIMRRKWVGIEINPEYCKIAEKRILEYRKQGKLF